MPHDLAERLDHRIEPVVAVDLKGLIDLELMLGSPLEHLVALRDLHLHRRSIQIRVLLHEASSLLLLDPLSVLGILDAGRIVALLQISWTELRLKRPCETSEVVRAPVPPVPVPQLLALFIQYSLHRYPLRL
jgi:hypothetical protein